MDIRYNTNIISCHHSLQGHDRLKNALAKSLFEYQTRFATNYENTIETLKTLYQKFVVFNQATKELIREKRFSKETLEDREWDQKYDAVEKLLYDTANYYRENRLFLPFTIAEKLLEILGNADSARIFLFFGLQRAERTEQNHLVWAANSGLTVIDKDKNEKPYPDVEELLRDMENQLDNQAENLEKIYHSAAEIRA